MTLRLTLAAATLGLAVGVVVFTAFPPPRSAEGGTVTVPTTVASTTAVAADQPTTAARTVDGVVVVWTPVSLPSGLAEEVVELPMTDEVAEVRAGLAHLVASRDASGSEVDRAPKGMVIPLEVVGVDPDDYGTFIPKRVRSLLGGLSPDEVILGATSVRLRGIGEGGTLETEDGRELVVAGVLDDTLVGGAELLTTHPDRLGITVPRHLMVRYRGDRASVEEAIRSVLTDPARVRGPGEAPFLRFGDAVLPQALIKQTFGEFAYRPGEGRWFHQDPAWSESWIERETVPLLGTVACHRSFLPLLRGAMEEIERRGLGHLVESTAGCWNPRLIAAGQGISRHAWGAAIDINYSSNPTGVGPSQDPRLVEVMEAWGLGWGGFWLVPDPAHFEYLGPTTP